MSYYHKLNDIKKGYQNRYDHCFNALKHVNLMCKMFDMKQFSKREWEQIKVDKTCFI